MFSVVRAELSTKLVDKMYCHAHRHLAIADSHDESNGTGNYGNADADLLTL